MAESYPKGKRVENTVRKEEIAPFKQFSFSRSTFKRLVMQTHKNKGLFGKGLFFCAPFRTVLYCGGDFSRGLKDYIFTVFETNFSSKISIWWQAV